MLGVCGKVISASWPESKIKEKEGAREDSPDDLKNLFLASILTLTLTPGPAA